MRKLSRKALNKQIDYMNKANNLLESSTKILSRAFQKNVDENALVEFINTPEIEVAQIIEYATFYHISYTERK